MFGTCSNALAMWLSVMTETSHRWRWGSLTGNSGNEEVLPLGGPPPKVTETGEGMHTTFPSLCRGCVLKSCSGQCQDCFSHWAHDRPFPVWTGKACAVSWGSDCGQMQLAGAASGTTVATVAASPACSVVERALR